MIIRMKIEIVVNTDARADADEIAGAIIRETFDFDAPAEATLVGEVFSYDVDSVKLIDAREE